MTLSRVSILVLCVMALFAIAPIGVYFFEVLLRIGNIGSSDFEKTGGAIGNSVIWGFFVALSAFLLVSYQALFIRDFAFVILSSLICLVLPAELVAFSLDGAVLASGGTAQTEALALFVALFLFCFPYLGSGLIAASS